MPKRRAHGEGALYKQTYQLRDGRSGVRWLAEIELPSGPNGERRRWRRSFRTRAEASAALQAELAKLRGGLPVVVERQTVKQFLEQWLAQVVRPHRSANTYTS